jgi:uncharacterized protein
MRFLTHITSHLLPNRALTYLGPTAESLEILVLQPTPFCNIDCDYCYLGNRGNTQRMSVEIIKSAVRMVLDGGLVKDRLCVVWHAGEPLTLPVKYYEEAFAAVEQEIHGRYGVSHSFQSNGTLIDNTWCKFLQKEHVRIGLSIDGPAFLHDLHRKTRNGKPTHAQTMKGVERLREHGIPFHVIAVVSADALDHAEAIFRFFEGLGVREVGFNIEELEGSHDFSSLASKSSTDKIKKFWNQLYELCDSSGGSVQIREFQRATTAILTAKEKVPWQELAKQNDQVLPFRILSVDCQGLVSTFSPELLGVKDERRGNFVFGQLGRIDLAAIRASEQFMRVANEVMQGVKKCSRTCEYFSVCGGGAPSNKYFENGSLSSTATLYCRTSIQLPIDVVLSHLERKANSGQIVDGNCVKLPEHTPF